MTFFWGHIMKISIDAGGTLLKIVYIENDERVFDKVPSLDIDNFIEKLNKNHPDADIYITGGKAEYMSRKLNHDVNISIEFDATYIGLKQLMNEQRSEERRVGKESRTVKEQEM